MTGIALAVETTYLAPFDPFSDHTDEDLAAAGHLPGMDTRMRPI